MKGAFMQYHIELCDNPDYVAVHVDKLILGESNLFMGQFYSDEYAPKGIKALVADIFSVEGIESIQVRRYEVVVVRRSRLFDRKKIGHLVAAVLHKHLDPKGAFVHAGASLPDYEALDTDESGE